MKKNLMTVLILALLIVNIILTAVTMFSVVTTNGKTARLVNNIATVLNLELTPVSGETEEEVALEDTAVYNIDGAMTIPLTSTDGKDHYIMFNISFSLNKKAPDYKTYGESMAEKESLIKDAISSVVSRHTVEECKADFEGLKKEILTAVQDLFGSDFIYKAAISEVKYQ